MDPPMLGAPDDLVVLRNQRGVQHDRESATLNEIEDEKGSSSPAAQAGTNNVGVKDDRDGRIAGAGSHGSCRDIQRDQGWISVSVRLIRKASCRSRKSPTTSAKAAGRSASIACPAS